jgi:hypothetical protein
VAAPGSGEKMEAPPPLPKGGRGGVEPREESGEGWRFVPGGLRGCVRLRPGCVQCCVFKHGTSVRPRKTCKRSAGAAQSSLLCSLSPTRHRPHRRRRKAARQSRAASETAVALWQCGRKRKAHRDRTHRQPGSGALSGANDTKEDA